MRSQTAKLVKTMTILSTLGTLITVGVNLARALNDRKAFKKVDRKLDDALEDSMDCSDATAKY